MTVVRTLLLFLLSQTAWSHPSASGHLHSQTDADCRKGTRLTRTVQGLLDEGRLTEASKQIEAARDCGTPGEAIALAQADWFLQAGQPLKALSILDPWLQMEPSHAGLIRLRMRSHSALEQWDPALTDAITLAQQGRSPEPWLQAIDLAERAHGPSHALQMIDQAELELGPLVVFEARRKAFAEDSP